MSNLTWKKIDNSREMSEVNGFIVIRPIDRASKPPISCPVCGTMMRGIEDIDEFKKLEACRACCDKWAYVNYDKWLDGWRPDKKDVIDEINHRKSNTVFQISLEHDN